MFQHTFNDNERIEKKKTERKFVFCSSKECSRKPQKRSKRRKEKKNRGKKEREIERERELKWWNTSPRNSTVLRIR